jgi:hypothetical protein
MPDLICHCGAVRISVEPAPTEITDCSICRRYGALWAYYEKAPSTISPEPDRDRHLFVGRQGSRIPPLQDLRLRHALGRHG